MTVYLVMGAPCSGKTTEALRRKQSGDIIIDADRLAEALGSEVSHAHPPHIKALAAHLRDVATVKSSQQRCDVYIVSASPNAHNTIPHDSLITMDTPMSTCLARSAGRPSWTAEAIREWFEKHTASGGKKLRSRRW